MQLVGDVNYHEANYLNRTAAIFLAELSCDHLPNLLRHSGGGVSRDKLQLRGHLERLKSRIDKLSELVEQISSSEWVELASPGWDKHKILQPSFAQRAILWVSGEIWEYPCRQKSIFNSAHDHDNTESYRGHEREKAGRDKRWDRYYIASTWQCVVDVRQMLEGNVVPLVRQTQADVAEALALYNAAVEAAAVKLQHQMQRLLTKRD